MLGNFSFGAYNKAQAVRYAWRFLTEELQLPKDRLRVTVFESDQETFEIWRDQEGLPEDRIMRCGLEDNFWSMGDGEGPCGPCTEIFWDTQDDTNPERWLEIWNLVFMQNFRTTEGVLEALPIPCIDTGMGMERLASVLQSKKNNYQIDEFQALISGLNDVMAKRGLPTASTTGDPSSHEKIIADHFRAMCFLIGDGVIPSNIGRGYVLRRIIRRALRSGRQLGFDAPFMTDLYPYLLVSLGRDTYPDLSRREASIRGIVEREEQIFLTTLEKGLGLLESLFARADLQEVRYIPSDVAFQLYDTRRGTAGEAEAIGSCVMEVGQHFAEGAAVWEQCIMADTTFAITRILEWRTQNILPSFSGYDHGLLHQESEIVAIDVPQDSKTQPPRHIVSPPLFHALQLTHVPHSHPTVNSGEVILAIEPCPFYGLGGGQVPDSGYVVLGNGQRWDVVDVFQPYEGGLALRIKAAEEAVVGREALERAAEEDLKFLQVGQLVRTYVDVERRQGAEAHHTATHLLNAALRDVLMTEVVQAGSLVEPDRLRFDFTYGRPVTAEQLSQIEDWVNEVTMSKAVTMIKHMPLKDAIDSGAVAVFSEKYADVVRVVEAKSTFELDQKLGKLLDQIKDLQRQLSFAHDKLARAPNAGEPLSGRYRDHPLRLHLVDADLDAGFVQVRANALKKDRPREVHVLVWRSSLVVAVNEEGVLQDLLRTLDGKGGGQRELAQARLSETLASVAQVHPEVARACGVA
ncbi:tRNA synthetases class II (A)-domain-containing protein [Jimgerdemannia flammicorona]|uniref:Alanine--tRNA ligase n=1 Tax=Jimgerdemannia flammicorona TaxID=994334 RepID=A0A433BBL5_9FUNG|nr:tRNA synthetases class II (A)-domain-containing protein [Jimgerdemannia flammicorona]